MLDYKKEFIKLIEKHLYQYNKYELFSDFCECAKSALNSPYDIVNREYNEKNYKDIMDKKNVKNKEQLFANMLELLTKIIGEEPNTDVLGEIYMMLEIADGKHKGQYFTPGHISDLCAEVALEREAIETEIKEKGYITIHEPCVGGGSMLFGLAKILKQMGYNPQTQLKAVVGDIDRLCVNMCYVQCTLNGLQAIVSHGDALTLETWRKYTTPMSHWWFRCAMSA